MLTLIAALLCCMTTLAQDFDYYYQEICYNLNAETQTAEVTYLAYNTYYKDYNIGRSIKTANIPETFVKDDVTYTVTSIGDHAFTNCEKLTSVTIPNTVTSIGRYAFKNCDVLAEIDIPNSVKTIGDGAFQSCSGYVTENQYTGLTTVTIGSGVTSIGSGVFDNCTILTAINVSNGNLNFSSQDGVLFSKYKKVLITYPCGKEGNNGFYTIPTSVTTIKAHAFEDCAKLTGVNIPLSVTDIEDYAFDNCYNLPIVDGLRYADSYLVEVRSSATSFSIREGTRWIGPRVFRNKTDVTDVVIPNSVTNISASAFSGCTGLSQLDIPDKVTTIGQNAFYNVAKIKYFGTATGGPWGAKSWIGGNEKEVYTVFDRSTIPTTLTYYYDNRRESHPNVTEVYDPNALRFDGIAGAVDKAVIDPSMKDAPLTSLEKLFYGGSDATGYHITLSRMTAVEGLENLNTANVTDMSYMFYGCSALTNLDLSTFNTGKLTTTTSMFEGCTALVTIYCNDDWSTKLTNSENMFAQCTELKGGTWPWTEFDATKTDGTYARPCEIANFSEVTTPGYFTHTTDKMYTAFDESTGTLTYYFDDRHQSRSGKVEFYGTDNRFKDYNDKVFKAVIDPSMKNSTSTSLGDMFFSNDYPLSSMTAIEGLENLNTAIVVDMTNMFRGCSTLTTLDLSSFNTENVLMMRDMFYGCSSLKSLDLSSFSIDKLEYTVSMFGGCSSLTTIYCDQDWSGITYGNWMFSNCNSLMGGRGTQFDYTHDGNAYARPDEGSSAPGYFTTKEAKVYTEFDIATGTLTYRYDDQFNISPYVEFYDPIANPSAVRFTGYNEKVLKVVIDPSMKNANLTSFENMFWGCTFSNCLTKMKSIEGLENLNTANVTNMAWMFAGCNSVETLDLTTFDISKVTDMSFMLSSCKALMTIFCNEDWSANPALTSDLGLFSGSTMIIGGHGTSYDSSTYDKTYAHPDRGESSPGYFTMRGDANGDDHVSITDAVSIVNAILGNPSSDFSKGAANINGDVDEAGEPNITITDAVGVVNIILDEGGVSEAPAMDEPETPEQDPE
jgi:surface protein